jgi:16S rRNA (adenine1518-N6/adenine1519-N6)-dimethyltransferase
VNGAEFTVPSAGRLLRQFDIKPRKGLGQNFLISEGVLRRIIDAADLSKQDVVIEVGAGLGTLTRRLARQAGRVVALEVDQRLLPILHETLARHSHVEIVHGDVLAIQPNDLVSGPYKVVANLPYYITSAVLRHFLEAAAKPSRMVVTVQKEVVERITAGPGDMSQRPVLRTPKHHHQGGSRRLLPFPPGALRCAAHRPSRAPACRGGRCEEVF